MKNESHKPARWSLSLAVLAALAANPAAAQVPKAPVPSSPYIAIVYRYADAMLEHGRDTIGPRRTGLFLSALDRATLGPLTNRPAAPAGIRENDRAGERTGPLTGANPHHDENLLRLLYTLSELSGKAKYREAADAELKWFLENTASPVASPSLWTARLTWDVLKDAPLAAEGGAGEPSGFLRPWMLWDRCFVLAGSASGQRAETLGQGRERNAGLPDLDSLRQAGFELRTWAVAHAQTHDPRFLAAVGALLERLERNRLPQAGPTGGTGAAPNAWAASPSALSLAIDCDGAAHRLPEPLASRLRAFAARADEMFCALPHELTNTGGFLSEPGQIRGGSSGRVTARWTARDGIGTTAQVGMMCVSRYDNTGRIAFRELIRTAADAYLRSLPVETDDVWPGTFGQAISLELAAWRSTARPAYLARARELADVAVSRFFGERPLPRASLNSEHYESITGADTLSLALLELHLQILHITAVRCPPNTLDR